MASGKAGFGIGGGIEPPVHVTEAEKLVIAGDQTALLKSMELSLKRLADKYA